MGVARRNNKNILKGKRLNKSISSPLIIVIPRMNSARDEKILDMIGIIVVNSANSSRNIGAIDKKKIGIESKPIKIESPKPEKPAPPKAPTKDDKPVKKKEKPPEAEREPANEKKQDILDEIEEESERILSKETPQYRQRNRRYFQLLQTTRQQ